MRHAHIHYTFIAPVGALVSALVLSSAGRGFESFGDGQGYELFGEIAPKNRRFMHYTQFSNRSQTTTLTVDLGKSV